MVYGHNRLDLLIWPPGIGLKWPDHSSILIAEGPHAKQLSLLAEFQQGYSSVENGPEVSALSLRNRNQLMSKNTSSESSVVQWLLTLLVERSQSWLSNDIDAQGMCIGFRFPQDCKTELAVSDEVTRPCPFKISLDLNTALLMFAYRSVAHPDGHRLVRCLKLRPRCLHCHTTFITRKVLQEDFFSPSHKGHSRCEARYCLRSRWQNVGKYCDEHYLASCSVERDFWDKRSDQLPFHLRGQEVSLLQDFNRRVFSWGSTDSVGIVDILLQSNPEAPNVYAIDTEHWLSRQCGQQYNIREVAICNVRTGQLVVNAALEPVAAFKAAERLRLYHAALDPEQRLMTKHIQQVHTVDGMVQQLKRCSFRPDDIFVDYSTYVLGRDKLDLRMTRMLLEQHGYNSEDLIPAVQTYAFFRTAKQIFNDVLKLKTFSMAVLFQTLFPQDPLANQNHSASIDAIQLARIVQVAVEVSKPRGCRQLPNGLFQGLDHLLSECGVREKPTITLDDFPGFVRSSNAPSLDNSMIDPALKSSIQEPNLNNETNSPNLGEEEFSDAEIDRLGQVTHGRDGEDEDKVGEFYMSCNMRYEEVDEEEGVEEFDIRLSVRYEVGNNGNAFRI